MRGSRDTSSRPTARIVVDGVAPLEAEEGRQLALPDDAARGAHGAGQGHAVPVAAELRLHGVDQRRDGSD